MTLYKLTDEKYQTFGETQWGEGVTHITNGEGELCGPGWIHAYPDPYLAILLDPIHGKFGDYAEMWLTEGGGEVKDDKGLKCGVTQLTTLRVIDKPNIALEQRVAFAIRCAKVVCKDPTWNQWTDRWLDGSDRSAEAAEAARAVWTAEMAAQVWPPLPQAAKAARAAAWAAKAAKAAAWAAKAAKAAAWAAKAAKWGGEAAEWTAAAGLAVKWGAERAAPIDFAPIIKQVFGT